MFVPFIFHPSGRPKIDHKIHDPHITVTNTQGTPTPVSFYSSKTAHATLGHVKAPDDNNKAQIQAIVQKATQLSRDFSLAPMDQDTAFQFYRAIFNPSIGYTFAQSTITAKQFRSMGNSSTMGRIPVHRTSNGHL
jgi:hypothetical protein